MSSLGNLIPLVILFAFVGGLAYIGYQITQYTNDLADRGKKNMEKKNIVFAKDGMKVGVKEVKNEAYADKTQSVLVNAWNLGKSESNRRSSPSGSKPPTRRTTS